MLLTLFWHISIGVGVIGRIKKKKRRRYLIADRCHSPLNPTLSRSEFRDWFIFQSSQGAFPNNML